MAAGKVSAVSGNFFTKKTLIFFKIIIGIYKRPLDHKLAILFISEVDYISFANGRERLQLGLLKF